MTEENPGQDLPEMEESELELEQVEMLSREETRQALYAMLFSSDRPMSAARLAEALGDIDADIVANLLAELAHQINGNPQAPYVLKEIAGGHQLLTKPQYAPFIRRLLRVKKSNRMSRSLLETLAIIAYKQPVTRAEVEAIRGVSVSYAFDQLQEKRLVKVAGDRRMSQTLRLTAGQTVTVRAKVRGLPVEESRPTDRPRPPESCGS